jgi:hypothetical protein
VALEVFLDGVDITSISLEGSWSLRLNRPREATVRIPMSERFGGGGSKLKIVLDEEIMFHGFVQMVETQADENVGYCVYTAMDIMELWRWRLVRDSDGDYSYPTIIEDFGGPGGFSTGGAPFIVEQMILNSIDSQASADEDGPDGTLFLTISQVPLGGVDMRGAPVDWPMTMMEMASLLCSTGELDIVLTPIDTGGNMADLKMYHGDYGEDLSSEIVFEYGGGARNIRAFSHVEDFSNVVNKLRYLLGPRRHPIGDPKSLQHWAGSIDGHASGTMPDPPLTQVRSKQITSRNLYGTRMDLRIYDNRQDENDYRMLFERLWFIEAWLRAGSRTLVHITPTRDTEINTFTAGDIVGINLYSTAFPGGVFGAQRVYGYTVSWDTDSVLFLSELQTSADQDGFPT